ncbi:MAG TPA: transglutaminase family protein [Candidatus Baltobacteraceae bacterium]|jgi:transglutaminase-like putative cysteine protease|nr:transglutaminase family protein [Candidatus Baltobacteraceae bacterium]
MKWRIHHRTLYTYATPARDSFNEVRLTPANDVRQTLEFFSLQTTPAAATRRYNDFCSNIVHHFEIATPHTSLLIESYALVSTHPTPALSESATFPPLSTDEAFSLDYLSATRFVDLDPATWRLAIDATTGITDRWQAALAIMGFVYGYLTYAPASTHVHTHLRDVLAHRCGVCQDFAHMMLGLCRTLKMPARYVSGYLATEEASATHAWVEVLLPTVGWHPLDPTHDRQIDETYIKIGTGRDYSDVAPVAGYYKGSLHRKMEVDVKIEPS